MLRLKEFSWVDDTFKALILNLVLLLMAGLAPLKLKLGCVPDLFARLEFYVNILVDDYGNANDYHLI